MTRTGIVKEIDSRDPQKVKTDNCSRKFRKVLEICQRRSTSMISNDTESQSEYLLLIFAVLLIDFIVFIVTESHNFLPTYLIYY